MRHLAVVLALLLPCAAATIVEGQGDQPPPLLLVGFAVDLPGSEGDDAVAVANSGPTPVPLDGWTLTDGEGQLTWPSGAVLPAASRIVVAVNATAWTEAARSPPDYAVAGPGSAARMVSSGSFLLSRAADEIRLTYAGTVVDAVSYGSSSGSAGWQGPPIDLEGSPFLRWYGRNQASGASWVDSNASSEWTSTKPRFVGATDHVPARVEATGPILAYVSPDSSRTSVRAFLQSANRTLRLNAYELADAEVLGDLVAAVGRGADVRVLLDEQPVGMTAEERSARDGMIARLEETGATVRFAVHERIAYNHAKYAVADGRLVLVQTENFVATGIPWDSERGNRGWGLVVQDEALAAYMERVFDADWELDPWTARAWSAPDPPAPPPNLFAAELQGRPTFPAKWLAGPATVSPVVAPDHVLEPEDPVLATLQGAKQSIRVAQLQFPPEWKDRSGRAMENEYLAGLLDAAARGVEVRVLVDTHFVDADDETVDNLDTLAMSGAADGRFQVRAYGPERSGVLHAKGMVVDDEIVLVGSMNWNLNSPSRNREVSLLVESPAVAAYFAEVFDADWDDTGGFLDLPSVGPAALIASVITLTLLLGASCARRST